MTRVAIIGCGAITETFHLPAAIELADEIILVDPDRERADILASRCRQSQVFARHNEIPDSVDAAVVATPHSSHAAITRDLLRAGIPVLCEKPLGSTVAEVEEIIRLSQETGLPVGVNQTRRFIPACEEIHRIVRSGELGPLRRIVAVEGDRFDWPSATASMFGKRSGGRGLLLDIGVHVLDLVTWWTGSDLELVDYVDDSLGGSEASLRASLRAGSVDVEVRLSWLAKQQNEVVLDFERGAVVWDIYDLDTIRVRTAKGAERARTVRSVPRSFASLGPLVMGDFLSAAATKAQPRVAATEVLSTMRVIEEAYRQRRTFKMPWHRFETVRAHA